MLLLLSARPFQCCQIASSLFPRALRWQTGLKHTTSLREEPIHPIHGVHAPARLEPAPLFLIFFLPTHRNGHLQALAAYEARLHPSNPAHVPFGPSSASSSSPTVGWLRRPPRRAFSVPFPVAPSHWCAHGPLEGSWLVAHTPTGEQGIG